MIILKRIKWIFTGKCNKHETRFITFTGKDKWVECIVCGVTFRNGIIQND
jgi:hypothetical protein